METNGTNNENLDLDLKNSSNEAQPEENKEFLDLNLNSETKTEEESSEGKPAFNIKTIAVVLLLLLPVIWIIFKTMGNSSTEQQAANSAPKIDIAAYENAANANPNFSNLLNLSNAYINSGMAVKAIEPLKKAIELSPDNAAALSNLGFAYTIIGQFKNGVYYGELAVKADTSFLLAKNNLNWAKNEQKKLLDALTNLEKTPEDKRDVSFYTMYGLQFLKLQEYEKSIAVWDKMLSLDPKSAIALINKGVAYMSLNEYDKAIDAFKMAVDNNPNDQLSKNNLNWALGEKKKAEELEAQNRGAVQSEPKADEKAVKKAKK